MTDSPPVLAARDVVVERGSTRPLDGLSIDIPAGSTTLIRGPSGAGKSTLFEILGLLDTPDEGSLLVGDTDAATLSDRGRTRLRRDHIGVVFQEFNLIPDLTAWENARLPLDHADRTDDEWLATLFDRLAVSDLRDRYPESLSGGEKQRIAIARALATRPEVVLADEPTGHLDPETADRVLELLLDSPAFADAAVVVVSHDPVLADRFERVYELVDGELSRE